MSPYMKYLPSPAEKPANQELGERSRECEHDSAFFGNNTSQHSYSRVNSSANMEKANQFLEDECGKRRIKRVLEESSNAASRKELSETTAHLRKAQERKRKIKGLKGNEKSHKKRKMPMDSKDLENRSMTSY